MTRWQIGIFSLLAIVLPGWGEEPPPPPVHRSYESRIVLHAVGTEVAPPAEPGPFEAQKPAEQAGGLDESLKPADPAPARLIPAPRAPERAGSSRGSTSREDSGSGWGWLADQVQKPAADPGRSSRLSLGDAEENQAEDVLENTDLLRPSRSIPAEADSSWRTSQVDSPPADRGGWAPLSSTPTLIPWNDRPGETYEPMADGLTLSRMPGVGEGALPSPASSSSEGKAEVKGAPPLFPHSWESPGAMLDGPSRAAAGSTDGLAAPGMPLPAGSHGVLSSEEAAVAPSPFARSSADAAPGADLLVTRPAASADRSSAALPAALELPTQVSAERPSLHEMGSESPTRPKALPW